MEWFKAKLGGNHNITLELVKLQNRWANLVKETAEQKNTAENTDGVRWSINKEFSQDIENWYNGDKSDNERFILGTTSDVIQGLGARENDIYLNSKKVNEILKSHPEMGIEEIKRIPEILENPVIVLSSKNNVKNNSRLVMFGTVKAQNGKPILCVLDLMPIEDKLYIDDMQKVASSYTKTNSADEIKKFFENSEVLYTSKNKKLTTDTLRRVGFSMPTALLTSGYIGSISYQKRNVKLKGKPFNEVFSYDISSDNQYMQGGENNSKSEYSVPREIDSEYLELAKDPEKNETKLRKMVDEAAKEKGYNSPMLYHGTTAFGFTQFERMLLDDRRSIFLTDSERIASTYSGVEGKININDKAVIPENISSVIIASELNANMPDYEKDNGYSYMAFNEQARKNLVEKIKSELGQVKMFLYTSPKLTSMSESDLKTLNQLKEELDKTYNPNGNNISTPLYLLARGGFFAGWRDVKVLDLESNIRLAQKMSNLESNEDLIAKVGLDGYDVEVYTKEDARDLLSELQKRGNYALYLNSGDSLKVNCNGKYWNKLKYRADISRFYTVISGLHGYRIYNSFTDQTLYLANNETGEYESIDKAFEKVKQIAKEKPEMLAYTELDTTRQISKYADLCGYNSVEFRDIADNGGSNDAIPHNETSNIYIAFDNTQVKSADLVTYDDNGNIIPLSKRFNSDNEDIRYSVPRVDRFNADDYNEINIDDRREYAMVMSAIRTQDGEDFTPGQVRKVYAYDTSYLYYYDNNGKPIIVQKDVDVGFKTEVYNNVDKRRGSISSGLETSRSGYRLDNNGNVIYKDQGTANTDGRVFGGTIPGERRSDRTGYTESGNNVDSNEEADGLTPAFSMPENEYSIPKAQSDLLQRYENGEISREEYLEQTNANWNKAISENGAIDDGAEVPAPKSVDGEKAVSRVVNNILNHAELNEDELEGLVSKTLMNEMSHELWTDETAAKNAERSFKNGTPSQTREGVFCVSVMNFVWRC